MRNYYMNEHDGKIYTEVEKSKFEADGNSGYFVMIGQFKSRAAAWNFYRDNM